MIYTLKMIMELAASLNGTFSKFKTQEKTKFTDST